MSVVSASAVVLDVVQESREKWGKITNAQKRVKLSFVFT